MSPTVKCPSYSVDGTGVAPHSLKYFTKFSMNAKCSQVANAIGNCFWAKVTKGVGQTFAQHGAQKKSQQPAGLWKVVDREYLAAFQKLATE